MCGRYTLHLTWAQLRALMVGFFEPMGSKPTKRSDPPRRQFYFRMADQQPFLVAGVWAKAVEQDALDTFALVTTAPNATVEPIHGRMPAILDAANLHSWLGETQDVAAMQALLAPWAGEPLETYEVDARRVNARDSDGPECIEPIAA